MRFFMFFQLFWLGSTKGPLKAIVFISFPNKAPFCSSVCRWELHRHEVQMTLLVNIDTEGQDVEEAHLKFQPQQEELLL